MLVAYIVVIYLATKDPDDNGDQETTTMMAPGEARGADEVHVNTGAVVSDNVACSNIGRSEFSSCNVAIILIEQAYLKQFQSYLQFLFRVGNFKRQINVKLHFLCMGF